MTVIPITERQKEQLLQVTPSSDGMMEYRPCQVTLKNGETVDNVYIQEEKSYLATWGVMPDADPGKRYLLIEDVVEIKESLIDFNPTWQTNYMKLVNRVWATVSINWSLTMEKQ